MAEKFEKRLTLRLDVRDPEEANLYKLIKDRPVKRQNEFMRRQLILSLKLENLSLTAAPAPGDPEDNKPSVKKTAKPQASEQLDGMMD